MFCDIVRQEVQRRPTRVIAENADMVAVAPYAPRFPFETWILPKRHQALFEDAPRHEYASLARLLGDILRRMNTALAVAAVQPADPQRAARRAGAAISTTGTWRSFRS